MQHPNYQKQMEQTLDALQSAKKVPRLLLHSCCAPCSSYVLEYLASHFQITVFYYNPNIAPRMEYEKRVTEQKRLISELPVPHPIAFLEGNYVPERFFEAVCGLEKEPEGGKRCLECFRLRLSETAKAAKAGGFDFFTTTLSVSPYKNAQALANIGEECAQIYGVPYLAADFKKRGGYLRSIELSKTYGLYRQNFCGCIFSQRESTGAPSSS
ncbi:MAG: epoxyqueuosine reductase QueH [Ethanoligenens sp.]